ncbi:unnamed protein product [Prunus armeniaca]|uniref:Uncharacterized protein n=1 Tax=Prunus armeniaca TaxID=36596 RepID=A0A6J5TLA8_PRUAR|nr:unnamed protein product [Prunus armeniaca]
METPVLAGADTSSAHFQHILSSPCVLHKLPNGSEDPRGLQEMQNGISRVANYSLQFGKYSEATERHLLLHQRQRYCPSTKATLIPAFLPVAER